MTNPNNYNSESWKFSSDEKFNATNLMQRMALLFLAIFQLQKSPVFGGHSFINKYRILKHRLLLLLLLGVFYLPQGQTDEELPDPPPVEVFKVVIKDLSWDEPGFFYVSLHCDRPEFTDSTFCWEGWVFDEDDLTVRWMDSDSDAPFVAPMTFENHFDQYWNHAKGYDYYKMTVHNFGDGVHFSTNYETSSWEDEGVAHTYVSFQMGGWHNGIFYFPDVSVWDSDGNHYDPILIINGVEWPVPAWLPGYGFENPFAEYE